MKLRNVLMAWNLLLAGTLAFAQPSLARMHDNDCAAGMSAGVWKNVSLTTVEGRIKDVITDPACMGHGAFLSVRITVDGKDLLVHLGPVSYVNSKKLGIALGESIHIKGIHAGEAGNEYFVASEVTIKNRKLKLRDEAGRPVWARHPRGGVS